MKELRAVSVISKTVNKNCRCSELHWTCAVLSKMLCYTSIACSVCSFVVLKHSQCNGSKDSEEIVRLEEYLQINRLVWKV